MKANYLLTIWILVPIAAKKRLPPTHHQQKTSKTTEMKPQFTRKGKTRKSKLACKTIAWLDCKSEKCKIKLKRNYNSPRGRNICHRVVNYLISNAPYDFHSLLPFKHLDKMNKLNSDMNRVYYKNLTKTTQ